jgi:hypothetical protein
VRVHGVFHRLAIPPDVSTLGVLFNYLKNKIMKQKLMETILLMFTAGIVGVVIWLLFSIL